MRKISIIIPVYNSEKHIKKCVDSILNQDFPKENIEIVAVNDGSKDGSLKILNEYKEKYPNIFKIIDQKNGGVAKARYSGVQAATGELLTFIDNDDFLDKDFLKTLYNELGDGDMIISGYRRPDFDGKIVRIQQMKNNEMAKFINLAMWAKLYRTENLKKVRFDKFNNPIGEDVIASLNMYPNFKNIKVSSYVGYNWVMNDASISNDKQRKINLENQEAIAKLFKDIKKISSKYKSDKSFSVFKIRNFIFYAAILPEKKNPIKLIHNFFRIIKLSRG